MKAVLLAGGLGTRMREETEFRPKPMVEVGGRPVLWHIMKVLSSQGLRDFVVCSGYKGEIIKNYFLNYSALNQDFTVRFGEHAGVEYHDLHDEAAWAVTVADTGPTTLTGGRVKRIERYVAGERFLCTYGDGIADIDLAALVAFHESHGKLATMTATQPVNRFGILDLDDDGTVRSFREKPQMDSWINIGYFIFEPGVFEYLDDSSALEDQPLAKLAAAGQLAAYPHRGFWQPMDTFRESQLLNELWDHNEAPWRSW